MAKYYLLSFLILWSRFNKATDHNNGFESIDETNSLPIGWLFQAPNYNTIKLDSITKQEGKYSLSIENIIDFNTPQEIGNYFQIEADETSGKEEGSIELRGFMKIEEVVSYYAGLWLKLDGENGQLAFIDTKHAGTNDWAEYRIKLPYTKKVKGIAYGGFLDGVGKVWFDNFQLFKDGKPMKNLRRIHPKKAQVDTSYLHGSGINNIQTNASNVPRLAIVGQVWGFLKYHHPYAGSGDLNWDGELFKILASTHNCNNLRELSHALEAYIDSLPKVRKCDNCKMPSASEVLMAPDYGDLFTGKTLSASLTKKLMFIQQNKSDKQNYWVKKEPGLGHPLFVKEKATMKCYFQMQATGCFPYLDIGLS